jgi:hypothetical protein
MLYSICIKSAKYWELPRQKWKIKKKKNENHLSKKRKDHQWMPLLKITDLFRSSRPRRTVPVWTWKSRGKTCTHDVSPPAPMIGNSAQAASDTCILTPTSERGADGPLKQAHSRSALTVPVQYGRASYWRGTGTESGLDFRFARTRWAWTGWDSELALGMVFGQSNFATR